MPVAYHRHACDTLENAVLLSSGLGGSGAYWVAQIPALVRAGYTPITYDHRGTGNSPGELSSPYSISNMAQDVLEVLDSVGVDRVHFVGHALGGLIGLQLALHAPQRLRSLSLVNAWAQLSQHTRRCFEIRLALLETHGPEAYASAQPVFLYPADWNEKNHLRIEDEIRRTIDHFPAHETLRKRVDALLAFDASSHLEDLHLPTFVLASRDDALVPFTCSQRLHSGLAGAASLDLLAYGGHAVNVTAPDRFNVWLCSRLSTVDSAVTTTMPYEPCLK